MPSADGTVKLQLPLASAVVVPSAVPLLYTVTVLPASAVPVKVGVVALVTLSVLDGPLSLAFVRSGVDGALGAVLSTVTVPDCCVDG